MPGKESNPESKLRIRSMPCFSMIETCTASRADRRRYSRAICFARSTNFAIYRQNLINDGQQRIEGWLDRIPAIDRDVTVKYFLQHFHIRCQSLAGSYEFSSTRWASTLCG